MKITDMSVLKTRFVYYMICQNIQFSRNMLAIAAQLIDELSILTAN